MTKIDPSAQEDAWLADFTDSIMDGEADSLPAAAPNPEALALCESLLRLKHAFPKHELDSASARRMRTEVLERWRGEEQKKLRWPEIFRLDWLTPSRRPQAGMAFAMLAIAGILIVAAPFLLSDGGSLSAAAGSKGFSAAMALALALLVVILFLLSRRKS
jgi:hypothetical protein